MAGRSATQAVAGATLRVGTRGSALALAQARLVEAALAATTRRPIRLVTIQTEGDRRAADTAWGEGAFVAALERALLDGRIDLAVHSAKDVPTVEDERLVIGAYLPRADPRDALVLRDDDEAEGVEGLAPGCRVGTDSPRRAGFLRWMRPDLEVHPLHGNVDTRLRRLDARETDALVLAVAGLSRLGREDRIRQRIAPEDLPPAPGQGAVCVQVRRDDEATTTEVAAIDDVPTRTAVEAERAFLAASGGGCRAPIGALARLAGDRLVLLGGYARPDGSAVAVSEVAGAAGDGRRLATELAERLSRSSLDVRAAAARPRVIVTRAEAQATELLRALDEVGIAAASVPAIEVEPVADGAIDEAVARLPEYAWIVVTSANGAARLLEAVARAGASVEGPGWSAVGAATAAALEEGGVRVSHRPSRSNGHALAAELPAAAGERVLLVRGDLAARDLPDELRARGVIVDEVVAYRTQEAPPASAARLADALAHRVDAVLFASGSAVRGLLTLAADPDRVRSIPAVCIGPETAAEAERLGFRVLATAGTTSAEALARVTADALTGAGQP
jgi:hydroxymethylbilane synthase